MIGTNNNYTQLIHAEMFILVLAAGLCFSVAMAAVTTVGLRQSRRSWTWAALGLPYAAVAYVALLGANEGLGDYALAPAWLTPAIIVLGSLLTAAFKLAQDQKDRLHGGEKRRAVENSVGPCTLVRIERELERTARGEHVKEDGSVWWGQNLDTRELTWVRSGEVTHVLSPGASGQGKTHAQKMMADAFIHQGNAVIVIDPKNDPEYLIRQRNRAQRAGVDFQLFTLEPTGVPDLDRMRCSFPILGYGNESEATDSFLSADEFESPHFKSIFRRGMTLAVKALLLSGERPSTVSVGNLLDDPKSLAAKLYRLSEGRTGTEEATLLSGIAFLDSLTPDQVSGLSGAANRCAQFHESAIADVLLPGTHPRELDFVNGMKRGAIIHIAIDVQSYPDLAPMIIAFMLSALSVAAGKLTSEGWQGRSLALIDEMGSFSGTQGRNLLERSRSAGLVTWWSPQSLVAVRETAGPDMLEALLDNCDLIIAFRQSSPEAAELLAGMAGTREVPEYTHQVEGPFGSLLTRSTGMKSMRLSDEFIAHPNRIKRLRKGEALIIQKFAELKVEFVRVRGLSPLHFIRRRRS